MKIRENVTPNPKPVTVGTEMLAGKPRGVSINAEISCSGAHSELSLERLYPKRSLLSHCGPNRLVCSNVTYWRRLFDGSSKTPRLSGEAIVALSKVYRPNRNWLELKLWSTRAVKLCS